MKPYKPFDIVTNEKGDVGFIQEVSYNNNDVYDYAVNWIVGDEYKHAWWEHEELTVHGNFFVEVSKCMCHSFGNNEKYVEGVIFNK